MMIAHNAFGLWKEGRKRLEIMERDDKEGEEEAGDHGKG